MYVYNALANNTWLHIRVIEFGKFPGPAPFIVSCLILFYCLPGC